MWLSKELPSIEINMGVEVILPSRLYCWLESKNKDFSESHCLCKLVGCKSLSKTHFTVPKEFRCLNALIFGFFKVIDGFSNGSFLLRTHLECFGTYSSGCLSVPDCDDSIIKLFKSTLVPFPAHADAMKAVFKHMMYILITEDGAIGSHSRSYKVNIKSLIARLFNT